MTPESVTDPIDIRRHVEKFKRQAKFFDDPEHVRVVLLRFKEADRAAVYAEVEPFLPEGAKLK